MTERDLDHEYFELIRWAEARSLESDELLALCCATAGRVIAAHIVQNDLDAQGIETLVRQAQRGLMRGAGIDPDSPQDTKH